MDVGIYTDRVKSIKNDLHNIIVGVLEIVSPDFIKANIDQLRHGVRSTGKLIGLYKNVEYARMKNQMNPDAGMGNIDLILTHRFSENIFTKIEGDSIMFDSADTKKFLLEQFKWWDENIFGLTEQNIDVLAVLVHNLIVDKINERLAA